MDRHYAMSREEVLDICNRTPREAADRVFFTGSPARVAERLSGKAVVISLPENGGDSANVLAHLDELPPAEPSRP